MKNNVNKMYQSIISELKMIQSDNELIFKDSKNKAYDIVIPDINTVLMRLNIEYSTFNKLFNNDTNKYLIDNINSIIKGIIYQYSLKGYINSNITLYCLNDISSSNNQADNNINLSISVKKP